jgi:HK97 gp10 family phage protein
MLRWFGPSALAQIDRAMAATLDGLGRMIAERARELAPVDTGQLRDSIGHTFVASTSIVQVHADAPYAYWVEVGNGVSEAQPFLMPALMEAEAFLAAAAATAQVHFRTLPAKYADALPETLGGADVLGPG